MQPARTTYDGLAPTLGSVLRRGLQSCDGLLANHLDAVVRRYGAPGLGLVDLPPLGAEALVPAQIRASAALYFCREAERAGVLPFVEKLAEALATGRLPLPVGAAASRLMPFWRTADHRFTAKEREALYRQVFDPAESGGFDLVMRRLAEVMTAVGRERLDRTVVHHQVRLAQVSEQLARQLSDRGVGIVAFAARDIVSQIRRALEVLREPELGAALGGGGPWRIVASWAPRLLGRTPRVHEHVSRAELGTALLRWIADGAPDLRAAASEIERGHPLISTAEAWLAAGALGS